MTASVPSHLPLELMKRHGYSPRGYAAVATDFGRECVFSDAEYRDVLAELRKRPEEPLAVYIHVPFCHVRCLYCACDTTVTHSLEKVDHYLDALESEFAMVSACIGHGRQVNQLHVGGGTPNHLNEPQLARLMEIVERYFSLAPNVCTSIECNPRRSSAGQLELLYGLGFRRISFGVQDLNADVQRAIGRVQSLDMVRDVFLTARETGFQSINLDLVYGLPFQTRAGFQSTLKHILDLSPDRIACFSYAHDPATRPHQHAINADHLPSASDKLALFHDAVHAFTEAGYRWVGLDVFVRESDELACAQTEGHLHHSAIGYTPAPSKQVLAFGPSGIGEIDGVLVQNESDLKTWQERITQHYLPVAWGRRLSDTDRRRREAILSLMCNLQLPANVAADLAQDYDRLHDHVAQGLVEMSADGIRVTAEGRYLLRNLCNEPDAFLELDTYKNV
ncbi:oxygen-independent coproporphyrinogen III oxidase [Chromatium okenii]|uniref:oxygen-independent coproporphyrinogen III oxidase n=1 Tax=Chromatium okenii TaxID=61644 RepID=UPI001907B9B5|nr:oxygen-independent coproporphyrinogen III oxidase [Chromatium okenii]MBK1641381.1 oxygen-independent coproporphyrinogen III oxidase [Chromatium okenii]